jgi:beta-lactam-binding protein with PASTA domain
MSMMNDVGVTVSDNDLRVNPGEEVKLTITVHNDGTIIDMFRIEVEGLNEQWDWPEVLAHRLTPHLGSPARPHGDCMFESVLAINPPRNSSAGAGLHSFKVKVARDHNPLEETIVPVELEVRPFHSFALDLSPQRVTAAQGSYTLSITNAGNQDLNFDLKARDPEELCRFTFDQPTPRVLPGETVKVSLRVEPSQQPIRGQPRIYNFTITATPRLDGLDPKVITGALEMPEAAPEPEPVVEKKRSFPWWIVAVALVAVGVIAAAAFYFWPQLMPPPDMVPNVIGQSQDAAEAALAEAGLRVGAVMREPSENVAEGTVIRTDPSAGLEVGEAANVDLFISSGLPLIPVPDVARQTQDAAKAMLEGAELRVGAILEEPSADVPKDSIIRTDPAAGADAREGDNVSLVISSGPPLIPVPDVVGWSEDAAKARLEEDELTVGEIRREPSENVAEGEVIRTDPAAGVEVKEGTSVTLTISTGLPLIPVPDVVGLSEDAAVAMLVEDGFRVGEVQSEPSENVAEGTVIRIDPAAGVDAREGANVTLTISTGPPPIPVPDVVGWSEDAAKARLEEEGFSIGEIRREERVDIAEGEVIRTDPAAGVNAQKRTPVTLTISAGPPPIAIPDVVGQSEADAVAMLEEAGLTVGEIRREPSENVAEGTIMRISPAVGNKVGEGTPIDLVISNGPPLIPVPDVVGKSQADAEAALVGAGLIVGGISAGRKRGCWGRNCNTH